MCTVAKLPRAAGWAWGSRKAAAPLEPELCLPPILSGTMCYFGNSLFPTLKRPCNYWVQFGAPCYIITQLSTSLDAMKINDHESLWWKAKLSTHLTRIQNQAKQHWNTSIFFLSAVYMKAGRVHWLVWLLLVYAVAFHSGLWEHPNKIPIWHKKKNGMTDRSESK